MTINPQDLVHREVHYCVSGLVHTLANEYGQGAIAELCEQASQLSVPIDEYEEAAIQDGWTGPYTDKYGAEYYLDTTDSMTWACGSWQELCEEFNIAPYLREIFEHWIVSDWLAEKLAAKGERVDTDFAGMTVWGRTTTGQAIYIDSVIQEIHAELVK